MRWHAMLLGLFMTGCGRYFAGPTHPLPEAQQAPRMAVYDDGTVAYEYERLEIRLRPLSDRELNRAFASQSSAGAESTNPYTYGNWTPLGEKWAPQRFTVFYLQVKNYAYPKVQIDPRRVTLRSTSGRSYQTVTFLELAEYYRAHALAWSGNAYGRYGEQRDTLQRTLFGGDLLFSGQEQGGYLVFPLLAPDVKEFSVTLEHIALRFNYADEPTETLQLTYRFAREVIRGYQPPPQLGPGKL
jgi:hypothetical protein